jgi:hypothetical protein
LPSGRQGQTLYRWIRTPRHLRRCSDLDEGDIPISGVRTVSLGSAFREATEALAPAKRFG